MMASSNPDQPDLLLGVDGQSPVWTNAAGTAVSGNDPTICTDAAGATDYDCFDDLQHTLDVTPARCTPGGEDS